MALEDLLSREEVERRAGEAAHRLMNTPPAPDKQRFKSGERKATPTPGGASKPGKSAPTGEAS